MMQSEDKIVTDSEFESEAAVQLNLKKEVKL